MTYQTLISEAKKYDNFPTDFTNQDFETSVDNWKQNYNEEPTNEATLIEWIIEND